MDDLKCRQLLAMSLDVFVEDRFEAPIAGSSEEDELDLLAESSTSSTGRKKSVSAADLATGLHTLMGSIKNLFLVCFHLPIIVKRVAQAGKGGRKFEVVWAESLIAKTEGSVSNSHSVFWLGTVSVPGDLLTPEEKLELTG